MAIQDDVPDATTPTTESGDVTETPKRIRRRRVTPTRRGLVVAVATLVLVVVVALLWVGVRGLAARRSLEKARSAVLEAEADFRAGRIVPGKLATAVAAEQAKQARDTTGDPIWHLVGHAPFVGSTLQVSAGLAAAADELARVALPAAGRAAEEVTGQRLRTPDGGVDLGHLTSASQDLKQAQNVLTRVRADVTALPAHPLLSSVGAGRRTLLDEMTRLAGSIDAVTTSATIAVPMLGAAGPRRYFLALQNPAEARGTGGIVGAYAIVAVDAGRLTLERVGSDVDLKSPLNTPPLDLGATYNQHWGAFTPTTIWQQSNFGPNFADAASIWLSLWQRQTGQRLDGAIAIDPTVAGYLLSATGTSAALPDGTALRGDQVATYTESTLYAKYAADNPARKAALVALTRSTFGQLKAGADAKAVLAALARGAGEGRVLVASAKPDEQAQLLATPVGGSLPLDPGPFQHVVVNNTGGNKVDYYLDRTVRYDGGACQGATRQTTITVTLRNTTPPAGLTPYVAGTALGVAGLSHPYLSVYAAVGAQLTAATIDGHPTGLVTLEENGRPSYNTLLALPPGRSSTVVMHLTEPTGSPLVAYRPQPLPRSGDVRVNLGPCPGFGHS